MKYFLQIVFWIVSIVCVGVESIAQAPLLRLVAMDNPEAAADPVYLVEEGAEDTGTPTGWTDFATPEWDFSTDPSVGSESLRCADKFDFSGSPTFTAQTDGWAYFHIKFETWGTTGRSEVMIFESSTDVSVWNMYADSSPAGEISIDDGITSATSTQTLSLDTWYEVWMHWVSSGTSTLQMMPKGTGAKPTSDTGGNVYLEISTRNSNINQMFPFVDTADVVFDEMKVADSEIPDNPRETP